MTEKTLYRPEFEHDACGIGAVVDIKGRKTHRTVSDALTIVERLEHRAGHDAEGDTGDGVGILLQIPHEFYTQIAPQLGIFLGDAGDYGVGMLFLPPEILEAEKAKRLFEIITEREGLTFLGWRDVPVNPAACGARARECMPRIVQCFVKRPETAARGAEFDRRLYVLRRVFEHSSGKSYVCSLSSRTVVYKGMLMVKQLRSFYPDLEDERTAAAIAMVHSRFSTNTFPSWERAHPNRLILHNGEINTIRGNADRMLSRDETMHTEVFEGEMEKLLPVINASGSDSAQLDNTLEFLMFSGVPLPLAVMMTIPEPWKNDVDMPRQKRDMYRYYATMMEPWDGPAAILFSDGDTFGAVLDRNGLRPARYYVTDDDRLILSSEVGVLDIDEEHIIKKSRLEPGKMLLADLNARRLIDDAELKETFARRAPYGEWLDRFLVKLSELPLPNHKLPKCASGELTRQQKAFGYTYEDVKNCILPMAESGAEPTASMGADIPLAVLSEHERPLFGYFKQLFAQVTNPPIDALREEIVTDATVYLGSDGNLLEEKGENCRVIELESPILTESDLMRLRSIQKDGFSVKTVSILYYKGMSLKSALDDMFLAVDKAAAQGVNIIILSDRGVDETHVAIPSLLAVSAIEQHLIRTKKRSAVSIVLESAEPREVHHFAVLLGYGARAVCPYLAHETIEKLISDGLLDKDYYAAVNDYNSAVLHGVTKIASKMGISALQSYQSAQIFEAVGISPEVTEKYFTNTVSPVGGIGLRELENVVDLNHSGAFDPLGLSTDETLDSMGCHKARSGMEDHMYNPRTIHLLQTAVRTRSYDTFKEYTALVDDETKPHTLRGLLEMRCAEEPLPLSEIESAEEIVKRFKTGAMSYGSISQEAHECMALAMNRLGGKSNSGEGGEAPERLFTDRNSAIKQVASGRFGVTSEYLISANEIQIKMAQGAKPGEGGHLPGKKVYPWIAKTRHSTPGVALISPPPHHDIYSIEDLAELIYDLKCANSAARISVKLVSEAGVGTVAAGVAKAGAQVVLISGSDGGTGAAPGTSIHNAGLPWELGLAETHQTLIKNGLRSRVRLETDGKLMSGRDVAIACMLGAEEFGFATAPLVSMGCVMMRVCNLDTCPVGIATQNPELRKRFAGKPEYVENFMLFIAEELREHMARLGVRTVDELVGRSDLLQIRSHAVTERAATVDLSDVLARPQGEKTCFDALDTFDFKLDSRADVKLLPKLSAAIRSGKRTALNVKVSSTDRAFGTVIGSEITRAHREGLPDDTIIINCKGGGGQSFGAFLPAGETLVLTGDCNDGLGKGLSGGRIVVKPAAGAGFEPSDNIICGNVALYGATGGEAYIYGRAGERFCVRNSGADAVCEGVGDHGCEYMTGGRAAILGSVGRNFAAGMSGGVAYVRDEKSDLYLRVNKSMVTIEPVEDAEDIEALSELLQRYFDATGSKTAAAILKAYPESAKSFKKILPTDYARMKKAISTHLAAGESMDAAQESAFMECTRGGGKNG